MSQVIVRNSCILITDYTINQSQKLERCFSIWDPIRHNYDPVGMCYDKEDRILYIPRGIDIWYAKKQVGCKEHIVDRPNPYKKTKTNILMKYPPRDERQYEALRFTCGIGQEYEENEYLPQLSINLNTGAGKTYVSIATMAYYQIKSIVITGSTSLLSQWADDIKEYTNLTNKDIIFVTASMLKLALSGKSRLAQSGSIFLCTHGAIRSFADENGWGLLNQAFRELGIGMKFFDEAHQNFENMCKIDFFTNVFKTYYVTATPMRSDFREKIIYQTAFKNVPFIDLFDKDNDPHTDYLAIKFNSRPRPEYISAFRNAYGLDRNKYVDYITQNENFYMALRVILDMIKGFKGKTLMYIGTNDGVLRVYKWICTNFPEYIGNIGIFTSLVSKEDKVKIERNKKIILSTTKSAGAGEDIGGLKVTVVLAEPFKSEVLARQTLGRTRDPNTLYIELVDMGFNAIRKYYYYKLPVFNTYASSTSDTTLEAYELNRRNEKIIEKRQNKNIETLAPRIITPIYFRDERFFDYSKEDAELNRKPDIAHPIDPFEWFAS